MKHSDNLSKTLQKRDISAADGQSVARMTVKTLESVWTEEGFYIFWRLVMKAKSQFDLSNPCVPRSRKRPVRYEEGYANAEFHTEAESFYRQIYYQALDTITSSRKERFDQDCCKNYIELENLLIHAWNGDNFEKEFELVCKFYKEDLDKELLASHLMTLQQTSLQQNIFF